MLNSSITETHGEAAISHKEANWGMLLLNLPTHKSYDYFVSQFLLFIYVIESYSESDIESQSEPNAESNT